MLVRCLVPALALAVSAPVVAQAPAAHATADSAEARSTVSLAVERAPAAHATADSAEARSTVSLAVEPQLNDGRLVIKLAAENRTSAPVPFGPADVTIAKVGGQPIALMSLQQLSNDIRLAAGMKSEMTAPGSNTYATQAMTTDSTGHLDVSNFHGSMGVSDGQIVRSVGHDTGAPKPTITKAEANRQIAALKQAILQDSAIAPGQIAVGQLVSAPLNFAKGEDRTLHVWVKIAGDEHTFTIAAPNQ